MLSKEQVDWLGDFFEEAEKCQSLSSFEVSFTNDMREKFLSYGRNFAISERQWATLYRIGEVSLGIEAL